MTSSRPAASYSRSSSSRLLGAGLLLGVLSPACANLIGLDGFKAVEDGDGNDEDSDNDSDSDSGTGGTSSGGSVGTGGVDTGSGGNIGEVCSDDQTGLEVDSGCSAGAPMCDKAGGRCVECFTPEDCATDTCEFTIESCNDGVCEPPSSVDEFVLMDRDTLNGSFDELAAGDEWPALGWLEEASEGGVPFAAEQLTFDEDCPYTGCLSPYDGPRLAWLGGTVDWRDRITRSFTVPASATSLHVLIDVLVSTYETGANAYDLYAVTLIDSEGSVLVEIADGSNQDDTADDWAGDYIDEVITVQPGWAGTEVQIQISSSNDDIGTKTTTFAFDNVRITAAVSCD